MKKCDLVFKFEFLSGNDMLLVQFGWLNAD